MIVARGKYYLYRLIRDDLSTPFYIGIGTKINKQYFRTFKSEYQRAFSDHRQNSIIKNYFSSSRKVTVEILAESDDIKFIKDKEIEFIKIYGRKNNKTGILANLTDGGERNKGRVFTPMTEKNRKMHSQRMKLNNPNKDGKYLPFDTPGVREKVIKRMKENNPMKKNKDIKIF
jgi:hypothetical protein